MFVLIFETVPTVWYSFGTVPTVWYFETVPTVWYFETVPTVWYSFFFHFIHRYKICCSVIKLVVLFLFLFIVLVFHIDIRIYIYHGALDFDDKR